MKITQKRILSQDLKKKKKRFMLTINVSIIKSVREAAALHNYHNAHENKRLVSQRMSKLMWCQLVSEADHSLPFHKEGGKKTENEGEKDIERLRAKKDKQDDTL